jgi:actin-related protein
VTHVFPVSDGFVIGSCVRHIPLAGRDITKFVLEHLRERGEILPGEDAMDIAQKVKVIKRMTLLSNIMIGKIWVCVQRCSEGVLQV